MTLMLDERCVAMLAEFGIRWQETAPVSQPCHAGADPACSDLVQVEADKDTGSRVEPAMTELKAQLQPRAPGLDVMQWDELADTVAAKRGKEKWKKGRRQRGGGG